MLDKIKKDLHTLRHKKPLVLNISNDVTMQFMANTLLSLGAAPVMSTCIEEIAELVQLSDAININIGTLNSNFIALALHTASTAHGAGKPVILDPTGAGATTMRTQTAKKILAYSHVIKGNASEILALCNPRSKTHGVESLHSSRQALTSAQRLAIDNDCIVIVSGETDFITNGKDSTCAQFGHPIMAGITGMGCTLAATVAAFCAINQHYFEASQHAVSYFTLCGTLASQTDTLPGSFCSTFIK